MLLARILYTNTVSLAERSGRGAPWSTPETVRRNSLVDAAVPEHKLPLNVTAPVVGLSENIIFDTFGSLKITLGSLLLQVNDVFSNWNEMLTAKTKIRWAKQPDGLKGRNTVANCNGQLNRTIGRLVPFAS